MNRNMKSWAERLKSEKIKKALPILSFPGTALMNVSVAELINSSDLQARCMKLVADRCDTLASVSFMDLSVEAECFGAQINVSDNEVPTVVGQLIDTLEDAKALKVPGIEKGRTQNYIKAVEKASRGITDRPIFAGVIGPYSLTGRLLELSEAMIKCYTDPDIVHTVLQKASEFITKYAIEFKKAGADGIIMAEPAAGLLSPELNDEFSTKYVREIINAVQDEGFMVIYHNCGNTMPLLDSILSNGAGAYHFGNSVKMSEILNRIPQDTITLGNVEPAGQFRNGTPESIYKETTDILKECGGHDNFIISSGCDIPPLAPWENIDSFFKAVKEFYRCM